MLKIPQLLNPESERSKKFDRKVYTDNLFLSITQNKANEISRVKYFKRKNEIYIKDLLYIILYELSVIENSYRKMIIKLTICYFVNGFALKKVFDRNSLFGNNVYKIKSLRLFKRYY